MLIGLVGCHGLLELINTPEEILADSALYLDIYVDVYKRQPILRIRNRCWTT